MHGLKTLADLNRVVKANHELAVEHGYASENLQAVKRGDIVFIGYGNQTGILHTNAKGLAFLSKHLGGNQRLGPAYLVDNADVATLRERAVDAGLNF